VDEQELAFVETVLETKNPKLVAEERIEGLDVKVGQPLQQGKQLPAYILVTDQRL
jgi:hypothetical protein